MAKKQFIDSKVQERIQQWLNGPIDQETKNIILSLMHSEDKTLQDAFYCNLSFGTGGMRGIMGIGTNRINRYTIQIATQGLANYLRKIPHQRKQHSVLIGFDSRIHSQTFAMESAKVLAGNGIAVYLLADLRPTPFVSFCIREKMCSAGIMITASHNPKEYNGYKVYWNDGAQVVPPHDIGIIEEVNKIQNLHEIKIAQEKNPLIEIVNHELDLRYLEVIKKWQIDPKENQKVGDQLKITYTPLHGTGITLMPRALKAWGFTNINTVDVQIIPDGNFPTVSSPNPENPKTLGLGLKQMQNTLSDIFIATDPDADRMAIAAWHHKKPMILNGNQIASICSEYICQRLAQQKALPKNSAIITTIVSTDLISAICKRYHVHFFEVLTGFKYIGELIHKWEKANHPYHFLFGAEESYGYLLGTHSRDKDAIVSGCLIAEIALYMKVQGRTLIDFLYDIYQKYGVYWEGQKTLDFQPGKEGIEHLTSLMDHLRKKPIDRILEDPVIVLEDYQLGKCFDYRAQKTSPLSLPLSNVLLFRLQSGAKIVVRPSGTEPKLKIYAGVYLKHFAKIEEGIQECQKNLQRLLDATESLLS